MSNTRKGSSSTAAAAAASAAQSNRVRARASSSVSATDSFFSSTGSGLGSGLGFSFFLNVHCRFISLSLCFLLTSRSTMSAITAENSSRLSSWSPFLSYLRTADAELLAAALWSVAARTF